jgi:hypothetical protein
MSIGLGDLEPEPGAHIGYSAIGHPIGYWFSAIGDPRRRCLGFFDVGFSERFVRRSRRPADDD